MKVSVIFEDGVIIVDNVPKSGFVFADIDPNWRVVQWQDVRGWIEVHHGDREWLTDVSVVQPFIDMHAARIDPEPGEPTVPESITVEVTGQVANNACLHLIEAEPVSA
jgi:hypothetical protein